MYWYKNPEELWAEYELENCPMYNTVNEESDARQVEEANLKFARSLEIFDISAKNVKKAPKTTSAKALYRKHRRASREEGRYHNNESAYKYFEKEIILHQRERESREIKANNRYIVEREMETNNCPIENPFYEDDFLPKLRERVNFLRGLADRAEVDVQVYESHIKETEVNITKLNMTASDEAKILIPVEWKYQKEALQRRAERYKAKYKETMELLASYEKYLV